MADAGNNKIKRLPLSQALLDSETLVRLIEDEGTGIDEAILKLFDQAEVNLVHAVDRRILFLKFIKSSIEMAKAAKDEWAKRYKTLQNMEERVRHFTYGAMVDHGLSQLTGTEGKITRQKSPVKMELTFLTHEKQIRNIVSPEMIAQHQIPEKYISTVELKVLDTEALKEDLKGIATFPWVKLTQDEHVRIKI